MKGKYNMVQAEANNKNTHRGQVVKQIKEWEKHGVCAALREAPCGPIDPILSDNKVERINKVKGNFKRKILAVELAAVLILDKKTKGPTTAAKSILDTFNITVAPQAIGKMKESIIDTRKQAHE